MVNKIKLIQFIFAVLTLLISGVVYAESAPEFLVSWRAKTFVPPDYQGKIFPIKNSEVEMAFDVLDGNKLANLNANKINWYLDGNLIKSGIGLKSIKFTVTQENNNDQLVRIAVYNYKNKDLETYVSLPVVSPEAVIDYHSPFANEIKTGQYDFRALPYFFNVSDFNNLIFKWSVNGQKPENASDKTNTIILNLSSEGLPAAASINLSVIIQNIKNELERATKAINPLIK